MAKRCDLGGLLLVSVLVIACCSKLVAAEKDITIVEIGSAADGMVSAQTSTKWKFGYKPFYPWWPVETCGWDFSTTAYWQVVVSGISVCDVTYGKKLATLASTNLRGRTFASIWFGSPPITSPVLCSQDRARKRVTYVIRVSGSPTALRRLRTTPLPRSTFTAGTIRPIRGTPRGRHAWLVASAVHHGRISARISMI